MTNQQIALELHTARIAEIWNLDMNGVGNEAEINARYGFKHGWLAVNGESFNLESAQGFRSPTYDMD